MPDTAPYENEREASAAARAVIPPEPGWSILSQEQHAELLCRALEAAGVGTSEFESRTAWWLSGWEDCTVSIIARWVGAAYEAGLAARDEGTVTEWAISYVHWSALFPQGRKIVQPYPDEGMARGAAAELRELAPQDEPGVMSREVGPWMPAPEGGGADD